MYISLCSSDLEFVEIQFIFKFTDSSAFSDLLLRSSTEFFILVIVLFISVIWEVRWRKGTLISQLFLPGVQLLQHGVDELRNAGSLPPGRYCGSWQGVGGEGTLSPWSYVSEVVLSSC